MNLTFTMKEIDQKILVKIIGEIDAYTAPKLRSSFQPLLDTRKTINIIVDLSEVSYMDSTGLGVFVGIYKWIQENQGSLRLTGLPSRLKRLFDITGLVNILEISELEVVE